MKRYYFFILSILVISIQQIQSKCDNKQSGLIYTPIAYGDFFDKITILKIKIERIADQEKVKNVTREYDELIKIYHENFTQSEELKKLIQELKKINELLWDIEDDIRLKEVAQEFDEEFIHLARRVYFTNDNRGLVKRKINELLGSTLFEEKEYKGYKNIPSLDGINTLL